MFNAAAVNFNREARINVLVGNDGDFTLIGELSLKGSCKLFGGGDFDSSGKVLYRFTGQLNGNRFIGERFLDILHEHPFKEGGDGFTDFENRITGGLLYRFVCTCGEIIGDALSLGFSALGLFLRGLDDFGCLSLSFGNYFGSLRLGFLDTVTIDFL